MEAHIAALISLCQRALQSTDRDLKAAAMRVAYTAVDGRIVNDARLQELDYLGFQLEEQLVAHR